MSQDAPPEGLNPQEQTEGPSTLPPPRIQPQRVAVQLPRRRPYVTFTILGLTVLVYLLQLGTQGTATPSACPYFPTSDLPACYGLKVNALISAGQLWRFLTPVLLHGGLLHIGFNMYALYILGPQLERHYGHGKFLALYLASGFAGVVASFVFTEAPSLGASTAIFGLLAAQGVFAYQNEAVFGLRARLAYRNILSLALVNFLIGLSPGIDNWGHFGGALGGILIAWFGGPLYSLEGQAPDLYLQNQRSGFDFTRSALAAVILFVVLALGWIFVQSS